MLGIRGWTGAGMRMGEWVQGQRRSGSRGGLVSLVLNWKGDGVSQKKVAISLRSQGM